MNYVKSCLIITMLLGVGYSQDCDPEDCAGVAGGDAVLDNCGICDNDISNDGGLHFFRYGNILLQYSSDRLTY